ncbi:MAG: zinc-ribbon domain-containing protein [Oscillospiraceae bacterium]|nr:zinc-ribbon domain-containing protein [Oscillospiraceae bacterium]
MDMVCRKCGKKVRDGARFCPYCRAEISELAEKFNETDDLFVVKEPAMIEILHTKLAPLRREVPVRPIIMTVFIAAVLAIFAYCIPNYIVPAIRYNNASKLYENADYDDAEVIFSQLGDFKRSEDYVTKCRYKKALVLMNKELYPEAADAFSSLDGYADSDPLARECMLRIAESYEDDGSFDAAMSVYAAAGKAELAEKTALRKAEALADEGNYFAAARTAEKFCDKDTISEYIYLGASKAMSEGSYKVAADNFYRIMDYKDSASLADSCTYGFYSSEYAENGASEETVRGFYFLGDHSDSREMFIKNSYEYGKKCLKSGDLASAAAMFRNAGSYKDASSRVYESRYELGKALEDTDPASARSVFAMLGNYYDSIDRKESISGSSWYVDGLTSVYRYTSADNITAADTYYTTVFRKNDTLTLYCTAGTDIPSPAVTMVITFRDSAGLTVSADCENIRNSSSFSGSFSLSEAATGKASVTVSEKETGDVLRTFEITIAE